MGTRTCNWWVLQPQRLELWVTPSLVTDLDGKYSLTRAYSYTAWVEEER